MEVASLCHKNSLSIIGVWIHLTSTANSIQKPSNLLGITSTSILKGEPKPKDSGLDSIVHTGSYTNLTKFDTCTTLYLSLPDPIMWQLCI